MKYTIFILTVFISSLAWACPHLTGRYIAYLSDEKVVLSLLQDGCKKIDYTITYIPKTKKPPSKSKISLTLDGSFQKVSSSEEKDMYMAGIFKGSVLFLSSRYLIKTPQPGIELSYETIEKTAAQGLLDKGVYVDTGGKQTSFEVTFVPY